MKRVNFMLFMCIFMFLATTALMFLGFCVLQPDKLNLFLICTITMLGYLTTWLYYHIYKTIKNEKK